MTTEEQKDLTIEFLREQVGKLNAELLRLKAKIRNMEERND